MRREYVFPVDIFLPSGTWLWLNYSNGREFLDFSFPSSFLERNNVMSNGFLFFFLLLLIHLDIRKYNI